MPQEQAYRGVLVPLDGSWFSEYALETAILIARRAGAALHVARVHVPLVYLETDSQLLGALRSFNHVMDKESRMVEQGYLERIHERLAQQPGLVSHCNLLDGGIAEALSRYVQSSEIDLLVMTTHGLSGMARLWLGSVADACIRQLTIPILLLRPHDQGPTLVDKCEQILVTLDGSLLAEQIVGPISTLSRIMGAAIKLLHVLTPQPELAHMMKMNLIHPTPAMTPEAQRLMVQHYLERVATELRAEGVVVEIDSIVDSHPAPAILHYAQTQHVDMIALASHGRGGVARWLLGSVADKVLRGTDLPVLLYRSPQDPSA